MSARPTRMRHSASALVLGLALVAAPVAAQTAPAPAPTAAAAATPGAPGWRITGADLPADPSVVLGTLPNGMRYALKRNGNPAGEASVRFAIKAGSKDETQAQLGAAHFVEHMAFNGSANIPEGNLVPMLERLGLSFGADTNAETAFDHTTYQLNLPDTSDATVGAALDIMREIASRLTIAPEAVQRERGIILSEASVRNDAGRRRIENVLKAELPGNRLGDRVSAVPDTIRTISAAQLRGFYQAYYRPENATLVIVGDIDPAALAARITAEFADWRGTGAAGTLYQGPVTPAPTPTVATYTDPAIPVIVALDRVRPYDPPANTMAEERRKLLESVAGVAIGNRFQAIVLEPDSPILAAQPVQQDLARNARSYGLIVVAKDGQWRPATALGEQELRRAYEHGFTQNEIDEVKSNYAATVANAAAQAAGRRNAAIADELVAASLDNTVPTAPDFNLAFYNRLAPTITPDSVAQAFRAVWQGSPTLVHVSTKTPIVNGPQAIAAALDESRQVAVAAPVAQATQAFAYDAFGTPGTVAADTTIADLGIRTVRFANGFELNLKRTDWEPDKVGFAMQAGAGNAAFPVDQPGLGVMTAILLPQDGLEAHSATELRRILAGHQVSLGIAADDDAMTAAGIVPTADLELQMQLLAARLTATGFRPETRAQWQPLAQTVGQSLGAQPLQIYQIARDYVLTGGDGRFGLGDPRDLAKLSFDAMQATVAPQLAQGPVAVGLVGDFDPDAAIAAAARTLGALPARPARKDGAYAYRPVAFTARGVTTITHAGEADQGIVSLSYPTTDDADLVDSITRDLLAQAISLKAIDVVRERLGATYTPQASNVDQSTYPGWGHLTMVATAGPDDMDRIVDAFRQIAAEMRDTPISADLLTRAREPIAAAYARSDRQNADWLGVTAVAQSDPARLDRRRRRLDVLRAVTPADIQAAARRYLVDAKAAQIRVVPQAAK